MWANEGSSTAQKMKFSIKDFFSKCDQISRKLRILSYLLNKSFIFLCSGRATFIANNEESNEYKIFFIFITQVVCAKFRGLRALVDLVVLAPLRYRAFVAILWVQNIILRAFRGSKLFSRGYFVGPKVFLAGISWFPIFFSWVFLRSKIFSRGYFLGQRFFLVGIW